MRQLSGRYVDNGKVITTAGLSSGIDFEMLRTIGRWTAQVSPWRLLSRFEDHWEVKALITKPGSPAEIVETIKKPVMANTPHKGSAVVVSAKRETDFDCGEIEWRFKDDQGSRPTTWVGVN
jgi:hypothetical protein